MFNYCAIGGGVVRPQSMYLFVGSLAITAFAGMLAYSAADVGDDLFYLDVSRSIECEVEFGRQFSKVIVEDFTSSKSRRMHFLDAQGEIAKMELAQCGFEENYYICRWSKTNELVIDLSNSSVSEVTPKPKYYVHGYIKPDVFRPRASVTCPTN